MNFLNRVAAAANDHEVGELLEKFLQHMDKNSDFGRRKPRTPQQEKELTKKSGSHFDKADAVFKKLVEKVGSEDKVYELLKEKEGR